MVDQSSGQERSKREKAIEALYLRESHAHTNADTLDSLVGTVYRAHYQKDGQCHLNSGRVREDHHPLRGWKDYICPYCDKPVRVVFSPSSGGGITRWWGLNLPQIGGVITVELTHNRTCDLGLQIDPIDVKYMDWIIRMDSIVEILLALHGNEMPYDFLVRRCGGRQFEARVIKARMRSLFIVPVALQPPRGWKAESVYYFRSAKEFYEWEGGQILPFRGEDFIAFSNGVLLLTDRPVLPIPVLEGELWDLVCDARRFDVRFTTWRGQGWGEPFSPNPHRICSERKPRCGSVTVMLTPNGWAVDVYQCREHELDTLGFQRTGNGWIKEFPASYTAKDMEQSLRQALQCAITASQFLLDAESPFFAR